MDAVSLSPVSHSTVSLRIIDDYTLEETDKTDGKVVGVSRSTIAGDGKSMRVEVSSSKRGGDHDAQG